MVENFHHCLELAWELENRCTGNRTGGSNPSPSAIESGLVALRSLFALQDPRIGPKTPQISIECAIAENIPALNVIDLDRVFSVRQVAGPFPLTPKGGRDAFIAT